jgi:hypothetical protein
MNTPDIAHDTALDLARTYADLADEIGFAASLTEARTRVVASAADLFRADAAVLLEGKPSDAIGYLAASNEQIGHALRDALRNAGEGPTLDVLRAGNTVYVSDLGTDPRWPSFARDVMRTTALRSGVVTQLRFGPQRAGSLAVFANRPGYANGHLAEHVAVFGTHMSLALSRVTAQVSTDNLRIALETNREIAMAIGILMNSKKLAEEQAFDLLRAWSQHSHEKLRDVAAHVVLTGALPPVRQSLPPSCSASA